MPREAIQLACTECKRLNYISTRNKKAQGSERLEIRKFCRWCGKHQLHREKK
ncbi:MAG: 50S ribosomal protein L33 [Verrucomicrobiae bacterium]|nr:50S ribosomal protein L33 [Verrucomicrobiae bacterium]